MGIIEKAGTALWRCEHELRGLGADALRDGDYEAARRVTELAEFLADRRTRAGLVEAEHVPGSAAKSVSAPQLSPIGEQIYKGSTTRFTSTGRNTPLDYPRFVRRDDRLVKVGWSKKKKQEYEHTTPWSAVQVFLGHLRSRVRTGRIFTVEALMPVPDPDDQVELPAYQVYLALAWLRELGVVEKRGRDGYVANLDSLAEKPIAERWAALPSQEP